MCRQTSPFPADLCRLQPFSFAFATGSVAPTCPESIGTNLKLFISSHQGKTRDENDRNERNGQRRRRRTLSRNTNRKRPKRRARSSWFLTIDAGFAAANHPPALASKFEKGGQMPPLSTSAALISAII
jgi:hypothetical protein